MLQKATRRSDPNNSDDDVRADGFIADQNFHIGVEASPMPVPGWKSHPELREAEAAEISEQENPRVFPEASSLRDSRAVEMLSVTGEPVQICETRISISISSSFHRAETVWNIPLRLLRMAARAKKPGWSISQVIPLSNLVATRGSRPDISPGTRLEVKIISELVLQLIAFNQSYHQMWRIPP